MRMLPDSAFQQSGPVRAFCDAKAFGRIAGQQRFEKSAAGVLGLLGQRRLPEAFDVVVKLRHAAYRQAERAKLKGFAASARLQTGRIGR